MPTYKDLLTTVVLYVLCIMQRMTRVYGALIAMVLAPGEFIAQPVGTRVDLFPILHLYYVYLGLLLLIIFRAVSF